jgi:hypothetical protein
MVKLRLADSYLEGGKDVWIKCPKCGERFRPQRPDLETELGLPPASKGKGPDPARRKQLNSILSRIDLDKIGRRETDQTQVLDALPVIPEVPRKTWIFLALTIVLVAGLLAALGWVFHSSAAPLPPPQTTQAPPPPDYGRDLLLPDILAIRKDIQRNWHIDRLINYRGRESRFYKYYASLLAPDACQEISSLRIKSLKTYDGFSMEAQCLNPRRNAVVIEVAWDFNKAKITIKGTKISANLPLTPQTQPTVTPGSPPSDGPDSGGEAGNASPESGAP